MRQKNNNVTIEVELTEKCKGKPVLSICGDVWNVKHNDIICGGQCLDELLPFFKNDILFTTLHRLWKLYHLNDMHAGTPKQEKELKNAKIYDYKKAVEYLGSINLLNDDGYKYGTGWLYKEIPQEDLAIIKNIITK